MNTNLAHIIACFCAWFGAAGADDDGADFALWALRLRDRKGGFAVAAPPSDIGVAVKAA